MSNENTTQPRNAYALSWDYGPGMTTTNNRGTTYAVCTPRQFPSREERDTWVSNGDGLNREAATLSTLPYGWSRQLFTDAAAGYENLLAVLEDEDEDEDDENAV